MHVKALSTGPDRVNISQMAVFVNTITSTPTRGVELGLQYSSSVHVKAAIMMVS